MMGKTLRICLTATFFWIQGSFSHAVEEKKPTGTEKPKIVVKKEKTAVNAGENVTDKEVAAHLEMLKVMDMLDHLDLMKDMDMLDGGKKK